MDSINLHNGDREKNLASKHTSLGAYSKHPRIVKLAQNLLTLINYYGRMTYDNKVHC